MADKHLHLTIITPARAVFDGDAASVVVTAFDGELGVLPGHAPLMALLGNGALRVTVADGSKKSFAVRGGFLQVSHNKLTILTPEASEPGELKAEAVTADLDEWKDKKAVSDEDIKTKEQALSWVKARQKVMAS